MRRVVAGLIATAALTACGSSATPSNTPDAVSRAEAILAGQLDGLTPEDLAAVCRSWASNPDLALNRFLAGLPDGAPLDDFAPMFTGVLDEVCM